MQCDAMRVEAIHELPLHASAQLKNRTKNCTARAAGGTVFGVLCISFLSLPITQKSYDLARSI